MHTLELYSLVVFITCVTPGAGVLYTLQNAFNYGLGKAYLSPSGNAAGVLFMSLIAASGLGAIIKASPTLFIGIQIIGALVLLYFAYKSWTAPCVNLKNAKQIATYSKHKGGYIFITAALLQVTNPMCIVFLMSLMPPFIDPKQDYVSQMILLISVFVGICWLVHMGYSYTAALASEKLMGPRFSFWLNKISAGLFVLCSAGVIYNIFLGQ